MAEETSWDEHLHKVYDESMDTFAEESDVEKPKVSSVQRVEESTSSGTTKREEVTTLLAVKAAFEGEKFSANLKINQAVFVEDTWQCEEGATWWLRLVLWKQPCRGDLDNRVVVGLSLSGSVSRDIAACCVFFHSPVNRLAQPPPSVNTGLFSILPSHYNVALILHCIILSSKKRPSNHSPFVAINPICIY
ncbi:uncharacterized protein HKW66_Vig0037830 [Vigna angularis]|uniref:Uncharacterized protein n=1 Tax=Phaseolus angularis TaxID=3914 RepID=A0A8T0LBS5_PHAAN|nr:uncharacterized protein HKW66_Vig0037830 [Vigna angularis]